MLLGLRFRAQPATLIWLVTEMNASRKAGKNVSQRSKNPGSVQRRKSCLRRICVEWSHSRCVHPSHPPRSANPHPLSEAQTGGHVNHCRYVSILLGEQVRVLDRWTVFCCCCFLSERDHRVCRLTSCHNRRAKKAWLVSSQTVQGVCGSLQWMHSVPLLLFHFISWLKSQELMSLWSLILLFPLTQCKRLTKVSDKHPETHTITQKLSLSPCHTRQLSLKPIKTHFHQNSSHTHKKLTQIKSLTTHKKNSLSHPINTLTGTDKKKPSYSHRPLTPQNTSTYT